MIRYLDLIFYLFRFTGGPMSQTDTIELRGFEDSEKGGKRKQSATQKKRAKERNVLGKVDLQQQSSSKDEDNNNNHQSKLANVKSSSSSPPPPAATGIAAAAAATSSSTVTTSSITMITEADSSTSVPNNKIPLSKSDKETVKDEIKDEKRKESSKELRKQPSIDLEEFLKSDSLPGFYTVIETEILRRDISKFFLFAERRRWRRYERRLEVQPMV